MPLTILVIGPEDTVSLILNIGHTYPELTLIPASYTTEKETLTILDRHKNNADIILFSGLIPFQIVKQELNGFSKPMVYVPVTGTTLYRVLFKMINETGRSLMNTPRISIDTLAKNDVQESLDELEINVAELFVKEFNIREGTEQLVHFHYHLWIKQSIDVAITCVRSVYDRLIELGVPAYQVVPTRSSIYSSLEQVLLEGRTLEQANTQLAIGIIRFSNLSDGITAYDTQRKRVVLQNILIDFGEKAQALLDWSNREEMRFVTTRGAMEEATDHFSHISLLNDIAVKTGIQACLGIGFGRTANEGEIKAREALNKAKLNMGSCYAADIDGTIHGPIGEFFHLEYSIRSDNPRKVSLAKKARLSVATINKLLSYCSSIGNTSITALELSNGLGITVRSARRILSILEKNELAKVVGEEQPINRGRPRQLYRINLA